LSAFGDFYRGKVVLVTGHTGFKGSWLSAWLVELGAKVVGFSHDPPTDPSHFAASRLGRRVVDLRGDVRDHAALQKAFDEHRPDIAFHLAAQAIVRRGFDQPRQTFETNLMGTVNVLDVARSSPSLQGLVCITSDKCYENQEWAWGYRETDRLGGHDPYSASKACAELAIAVFQDRRFQRRANPGRERAVPISSVRAGNVIGGGDWAADRLVPDVVKSLAAGKDVVIRCPQAVRPWQHVLEAVSGYLWVGALMARTSGAHTSAYNFGPEPTARGVTVEEIVRVLFAQWPGARSRLIVEPDQSGAESGLLRLDCSRAAAELGWRVAWDLEQTLRQIVRWYGQFYEDPSRDMFACTADQISEYTRGAREKGLAWAQTGV
jgi:CDP-glucose 4,6-dehydratase